MTKGLNVLFKKVLNRNLRFLRFYVSVAKERYIAEYKRRKDSIKEFPEEEQILKNIMNFPEKKSKMKS